MATLITGTNSGLGKWLSMQFPNCDKLTRKNSPAEFNGNEYDLIIHCAASVQHCGWSDVSISLFEDNVFLTKEMVKIPHKKFILISSIDESKNSPYGISKRISEVIVRDSCNDYLVLRPSSLIGDGMRKNTFQKIIKGEDIALTSNTVMNYVLYEDVLCAIKEGYSGIKVLRSNDDMTIGEVTGVFEKNINFGSIHYSVGEGVTEIDTGKTSKDNVRLYRERYFEG